MLKPLVLSALVAVGSLGAASAHAGGHVSWSIGINTPVVGTVVSNAPAYYPAYHYAPARVYAPAPVYAPVPVYREAPRVVYYPARSYYRPAPVVYPAYHGGWHGGWHRGWDRRGGDWRDGDRDHGHGDRHDHR